MNKVSGPTDFKYPQIKASCQDCVFYNTQSTYAKPCKQLGVLAISKTCKRFTVNPYLIDFNSSKPSNLIRELISSLSKKDIHLFANVINQEYRTRKYGFYFGQEVMIRVFVGDYISNYASALIINANKYNVYIQGSNGFHGMILHKNILTMEEWDKKRKSLLKRGLIKDPDYKKYTTWKADLKDLKKEDYTPPSIGKIKSKGKSKKARRISIN